ncbi:MAG: SRPBCC family protein [Bacteroidia bacterium]|nr:SRPBCC family protein [Bacteroidia bacterium]
MPTIHLITSINAPLKRCFDLSRSIDLHLISAGDNREEAVAGRVSGFIQLHEVVTWRAKHFGFWFTLTSAITKMQLYDSFTDEMVDGPFKSLTHQHLFEVIDGKTIMKDVFTFGSPYGFLGKLADEFVLSSYLKKFLEKRNELIKGYAESDRWKEIPGFIF